jgi:acid phosphatase type 7
MFRYIFTVTKWITFITVQTKHEINSVNSPTTKLLSSRYQTDYGMFRFCIADTEHDWREGTEQYKFIEKCLSTVDRKQQPWLIFIAHRVLGYSSGDFYAKEGSYAEPLGRESLQQLWQKYRVDIAFYGHVHNYERTCPVYEVWFFLISSVA